MHSFWMQAQIITGFLQPIGLEIQATISESWVETFKVRRGGVRQKQSVLSTPNKILKCQKQQVASE